MESSIRVDRPQTGENVVIPTLSMSETHLVSVLYLAQRFGLESRMIASVWEGGKEASFPLKLVPSEDIRGVQHWSLRVGFVYSLNCKLYGDIEEEIPRASADFDIPTDIEEQEPEEDVVEVEPIVVYRISASDILFRVKGTSEISRFVARFLLSGGEVQYVNCLPKKYNGDTIFELPPVDSLPKRGAGLRYMDRDNDCYRWTCLISTSANIRRKSLYQFLKVRCAGSITCGNNSCPRFKSSQERNQTSWAGKSKGDRPFKVGQPVPNGGVVCFHCGIAPMCVENCPAQMFYMHPMPLIEGDKLKCMSRLAIHEGSHVHPSHSFVPREAMIVAETAIRNEHSLNPSTTPSRLKLNATESLMAHLAPETASGMSSEEVKDIWDSILALATKEKLQAMLRTVRMENPLKWEFDSIRDMQQNMHFPFVQRFLFPGQGSKEDRPHVFKMSIKGSGSDLDILRRMKTRGSLEGSWVSFDVMHRIHSGWLTFSAHVYDHNIRALCTIFTCELKSECAASLATAWRLMLDVAREEGLIEVEIYGFMADNASAGWNAVRDVFGNSIPNPERERSDAFHFMQSLRRHTIEGILESKREYHYALWDKLRNAPTYVEAYRVAAEIKLWWKDGNCIPGKLKYLEGWISWWVVRWRQWGNYIRLVRKNHISKFVI